MGIWKKIAVLVLALFISCTAAAGYAITPRKVAVLPPINTAQYKYLDDMQIIQDTVKKPFKYPYYTVIPAELSAKVSQEMVAENKNTRLSEQKVMATIAEKLGADIVVVTELSRARFDRIHTWNFEETYVESDVELKCYSYAAATKKYLVLKAGKYDRENESINTNADVVFKDLTETILVKLPYKRIPIDIASND